MYRSLPQQSGGVTGCWPPESEDPRGYRNMFGHPGYLHLFGSLDWRALFLKEVMGSKSFVFLGMTQAFWLFPLGLPRLLTIKECKWSFYVIANPEVFSAWLSWPVRLSACSFWVVISKSASVESQTCTRGTAILALALGKGLFFQVDLVGSQDSVDVMAVCWLRISGADVPLPTKSGASNHLRTLLCRTTTCFFCFASQVLPCFSSIFHETQKTACLPWKMNDSTTNGKLLISGRSLITLSSRGGFIRSCFCELVPWARKN